MFPVKLFFPEGQLVDDRCPDCSRDVQKIEEDCYYFFDVSLFFLK